MLHYGPDVHKKYTTICVMDDAGRFWQMAEPVTQELPVHPAFSLKGKKRAAIEAGGNWHYLYDLLEDVVDELLLAHPMRERAIAAACVKTDEIDARTRRANGGERPGAVAVHQHARQGCHFSSI